MRPKDFFEMDNRKYIYIIAEIGLNQNGSLDIAKEFDIKLFATRNVSTQVSYEHNGKYEQVDF